MNVPAKIALPIATSLLAIIVTWQLWPDSASRSALVESALNSQDEQQRQQAVLQLVALKDNTSELEQLLAGSTDPAIRAITVQGLADTNDVHLIERLFPLLDDPNATVRLSAAGSIDRLLHCRGHIRVDGPDDVRRRAIENVRQRWEVIKQYELEEELAQATSLAYYYDQHTQQIFEAPTHLGPAFALPFGPYQGMPAALRAAVFSPGDGRDPDQRMIGWLQVDADVLEQYNVTLPQRPAGSESTLIKRPDDTQWVYPKSTAGRKAVAEALAEGKKRFGKEVLRCPRPGV